MIATLSTGAGGGTGIAITDDSSFNITNLVVNGPGYTVSGGSAVWTNYNSGIYISNTAPKTDFTINNVEVKNFGGAGIALDVDTTTVTPEHVHPTTGSLSNVSITFSIVHDNGVGGLDAHSVTNLYVGHVQAYHNAGDNRSPTPSNEGSFGIFSYGDNHVVIERCLAYDNGWSINNSGLTGGIEGIADDYDLIQYNESYNNHHGPADGNGIVLDVTTHSMQQFNYTHDNDGAGLWLGAEPSRSSTNNVVRYSISQNDGRFAGDGSILLWNKPLRRRLTPHAQGGKESRG